MNRLTRSSTLSPLLLVALSLAAPVSMADGGAGRPVASSSRQPAVRDRTANIAPSIGDNAALVYYSIWMNDNREVMLPFSEAYSDMQFGKALPQAVADYLKLREADIKRMVRAGKMKHCDFGIDRSEGFSTPLPHLAKLRSISRTLNADAARCLLEGKPDDAADRFAAMFGLARHATGDRVLISSLVGIAIANVALDGLVEYKGAAMLTPAGRAKVLAAIEPLSGPDGFNLKGALEGEREMAVDATILNYDGPDAGRRFADEVLRETLSSSGDERDEQKRAEIERVRQMDGAALHAEVRKMNRFYADIIRVWDTPGAKEQIAKLEVSVASGEYGTLGGHLLPALSKCRISQEKGVASLAKIVAALRQADAEAAGAGAVTPEDKSGK